MDLQPPLKRARSHDIDNTKCIFCNKNLPAKGHYTDIVRNPTGDGFKAIFAACEIRHDTLYDILAVAKDDIIAGNITIAFHRSCRANYTSKSNLKHVQNDMSDHLQSLPTDESGCDTASTSRMSREDTSAFNVRRDCFICGQSWNKSDKLTQITTGTGKCTRDKVMDAASARHDNVVHFRMTSYPDLFAYDAKYHRACYAAYISQRNIDAAQRKFTNVQKNTMYDNACQEIMDEIVHTVLSKQKSVTTLSQIRHNVMEKLAKSESDVEVHSWKLKEKLSKHFEGQLVFIERRGLSDLVCSSSVTVGDALRKASVLQTALDKDTIEFNELSSQPSSSHAISDKEILYTAASILRREIAKVEISKEFYYPSEDISTDKCADFVPNELYDFLSWIVDNNYHKEVSTCNDADVPKCSLPTISICHSIIAKSRNAWTPITLGIGLYAHHEFGSKQLIQQLNALGHSVTYDEVRRFLTSAEVDQRIQDVYIPCGLQGPPGDTEQIDAAIDNFDQNEETLDGKSTTHAMATVIYKRSTLKAVNETPIRRINQKSSATEADPDVVLRYNKPAKRPDPPSITDISIVGNNNQTTKANEHDLLWKLCRLSNNDQQHCPAWTGFNTYLTSIDLPVARIRYLPFIRAPPSDMSTIYTSLVKLVQLAATLGQQHILVTADMAIYAKAQEILWAKPPALDGKVTMRIGAMHMNMAFLASIGHLFGEGGLFALLTDSGVYSDGTARQMMQGKQYARGLRGIKLALEALFRVFFTSLETWLSKQGEVLMTPEIATELDKLQNAFLQKDMESAMKISDTILEKQPVDKIQIIIDTFRKNGCQQSETFAYWDKFLQAGDLLLNLLRGERDANFELHLEATHEAIPWFWAAGRSTYCKFVATYVSDMQSLEESHPESYKHLKEGGFVVRRSPNRKFNCVATDQALEQTVNRDGKSKGGVIGLTLRKGALNRWLKTRHVTAEYCLAFKSMCDTTSRTQIDHEELGKARMARDERDVQKMTETIIQYHNPFDLDTVPKDLVNIATGLYASTEVQKSLSSFLTNAKQKEESFAEQRLNENTRTKSFFDPVPRYKSLTFANMAKSSDSSKSDKRIVDSEVLFRRLLIVSKQREVSLEKVLEHELTTVPPSLFHDDTTMRKTVKSDLAKMLEATCPEVAELNDDSMTAYVIDGMALLQGMKESMFRTFDDLGRQVMIYVKSLLGGNLNTGSVAIVFDRYDNRQSIKHAGRATHGDDSLASHAIKGNQVVPNYRKFMNISGNKRALTSFISEYLISVFHDSLGENQSIILAGGFASGEVVKVITADLVTENPNLFSLHDEADTRMILHVIHLCSTFERIVVRSDDTDVLIVLLHYVGRGMLGKSLFMHAGHTTQFRNRERFIPITNIAAAIGKSVCANLPAAHALTGCDSTSSFFKIGKRTAYTKLVKQVLVEPTALISFGQSGTLEQDIAAARTYILGLYGSKASTCVSLDKLRYIFASTTNKSVAQLPPTEDAFRQHVMRARYQTAIWCSSHITKPSLWAPVGNGWRLTTNGRLAPVLYTNASAPMEVRNLTHTFCTDDDCDGHRRCHCIQAGLTCTELCTCRALCQNTNIDANNTDSDESDYEDDN